MEETQPLSTRENINNLKDDPESFLRFLSKYCKVQLIKNTSFSGIIHSIDPISNSIILAVPHDSTFQIALIPGHAVIDINEIKEDISRIAPFRKLEELETTIDVTRRKSKVMEWLKLNLLPVSECNENIVFGNVSILPPYNVMDICTDSPMVAMQIRKIIERMPQDF